MHTRTLLLSLLGSCALAACAQTPMPAPVIDRHPIQVAESIERLEIYPRHDGLALTSRDRNAMAQFLSGYGRNGSGPVFINVPSGGGAGVAAAQSQVRTAMAGLGMSDAGVQQGTYNTAPGAPAPLVVSYRRLKTIIPKCSSTHDLSATFYNMPSPEWGCAYHANIAAMVADPNQFLDPYATTDPNSARRMVVYDKYIAGEITGAQRNPDQQVNSQESGAGGGG